MYIYIYMSYIHTYIYIDRSGFIMMLMMLMMRWPAAMSEERDQSFIQRLETKSHTFRVLQRILNKI